MRPMRKGAVRTALTGNLAQLTKGDISIEQGAAILGGAIDEALNDITGGSKEVRDVFWRLANENCWRLWRALEASNQLKEIK